MSDSDKKFPFEPLEFVEYPAKQMLERSEKFYAEMNLRRTVRHFSDRAVDCEIVENAILTAGTAPSGAHKQPWHFSLVGEANTKSQLRAAAEIEEKKSYEGRMPKSWIDDLAPLGTDWRKPYLEICPWLIVVFAKNYEFGVGPKEKRKNYYVQESVGISVGFLLAALHQAGLATLTHTPSPMGFLQKLLGRPENERAYMLIALGYPEEGCEVPVLGRKPLAEIATRH